MFSVVTYLPCAFLANQLWECISKSKITSQNLITILSILLWLAIVGIFWIGRYYYKKFDSQLKLNQKTQEELAEVKVNRDGLIQQDDKKSKLLEEYRSNINSMRIVLCYAVQLLSPTETKKIDAQMKILNVQQEDE
ncbi:hypothetical protein ACA592_10095 [Lactiplantibacillus plantarum]|uniref:hypothetical protein n=1 Tax=Lactiplantibacillus plantarum TaxID=1590 RepID=UPI000FF8E461|nr:hypothetical protein [Lactiplantibacillus plantarum]QAS00214.1 hypothetical protein EQJ86_05385 [Lactiplantibacillus plantarum]